MQTIALKRSDAKLKAMSTLRSIEALVSAIPDIEDYDIAYHQSLYEDLSKILDNLKVHRAYRYTMLKGGGSGVNRKNIHS